MPRSIPPPRFPRSVAPPPPDGDPETLELDAPELDDITNELTAARLPKISRALASMEEEISDGELLEEDEFGDEGATQTRPAIVLPRNRDAAKTAPAREPWVEHAESLLGTIERTADRSRRMALHRELAQLLRDHDDPDQAFEVLVSAFAEDVDDEETVAALEAVTRAHDQLGELLRTVLAWSEDIEWMRDPPRLGTLLLRIAKWYGEDVGKVEWGMPFAQRARRLLHDRDPRPHWSLARLHRRARRFPEAEMELEHALQRASAPEIASELHLERSRLREDRGDERARVLESYSAALQVDPTSEAAIVALDAAYLAENNWTDRIAAWELRVASLRVPAALLAARLRLVEVLLEARQEARAAQVLGDVIAAEPENARALRTLGEVQRRRGDKVGLRGTLERSIEIAPTARDRVALLFELATLLLESFADHEAAVAALEQVVEIDPGEHSAYAALVGIYRMREQPQDVARVLERHAEVASDRDERADLLAQAAAVRADELGDRGRALDLAERAVQISPQSPKALEVLGRLYQQVGEHTRADEVLGRALDRAKDPSQRAELLLRRAQVRDALGVETTQIRELLNAALDLDPAHQGALEGLRALARADGDPAAVARACLRELEATTEPARRVALLIELARLRGGELDDRDGAISCWEEALYLSPTCAEAAAALIEPYAERGRWSDVHALASLLLSRGELDGPESSRAERARWHALLGRALQALGHAAEASQALAEAVRLDAGDVQSLASLAETRFSARAWEGAFAADQRLVSLLDPAEREQLLVAHHRMGRAQQELQKTRGAIASYHQALAIDPEHAPTLARLAEVFAGYRAWNEVIDCKRRLADVTVDVDARCVLLAEMADIEVRQRRDPQAAVALLEEAVELRPRDHVLLHKLLDAYQSVGDWTRVTSVLERVIGGDDHAPRRAKYLHTLGQILRDTTGDLAAAANAFERALDDDPGMLKAFEAINRVHTANKNWKALERSYRRMLHRVAGKASPELELELWTGLGLLYRDRMHDEAAALEAFRMASRARPDDGKVRRIVAELHARAGRSEDAATELHAAIERNPLHAESYRALFRVYRDQRNVDGAWCIASALVLFDKADDETRLFHARYQRKGVPAFRGRLDPPTFTRAVQHPQENVLVAKMFELILPAVRSSRAVAMRNSIAPPANVPWQEQATTRVPLARTFFAAADVLGIPAPRLALRPDLQGFLLPFATEPPSSVAGRDALAITRIEEMLFVVGQHLSTWRGDAHLRVLFPTPRAQEGLLLAALKLGKLDLTLPPEADARALEDARTLAQYLEPVARDGLRVVVKRFIEGGGQADLKAFARGMELTAARAGLLLCGDLPTAVQRFDDKRLAAVGIPASEVVSDLVAWFASKDHLELRGRIGVALRA